MNWRRVYRRPPARARFAAWRMRRAVVERWLSGRLARQAAASVLLLIIVVVITGLPLPVSHDLRLATRDVLTSDFDYMRLAARVQDLVPVAEWYPGFFRWRETDPDPDPGSVPAIWDDDLGALVMPVEGEVLAWFGWRTLTGGAEQFHTGIDIGADEGDLVRAAAPGLITAVYHDGQELGWVVEIRHAGRWSTLYARCGEILVREGDEVDAGDTIATVGSSGEPHLHFELLAGGNPVDPAGRLGLRRPR